MSADTNLTRDTTNVELITEARRFDTGMGVAYAERLRGSHSLIDRLADALEAVAAAPSDTADPIEHPRGAASWVPLPSSSRRPTVAERSEDRCLKCDESRGAIRSEKLICWDGHDELGKHRFKPWPAPVTPTENDN